MPSVKKVRWAQLKVGIMAIFALVLLGILVFLFTGERKFFSRNVVLYTYMSDSAALTPGSPVRLNGILIGNIRKVELSGESDPRRIIRITMEIVEEMLRNIPTDSQAAIASENVLGSKYINIKRGRGTTPVQPGSEIPSLDTREFEAVVASGYEVLTSLQSILKRVEAIVGNIEGGQGTLGKLLTDETLYDHLTGTVAEAHKVTAALNKGEGTVGKLLYDPSLYKDLRDSMARVDQMIEDVEEGQGTIGKLLRDPAVYNEVQDTVAELRQLVADLNAGKGTAGKLLKDEELHRRITSVAGRVDTLLEKINTGEGTIGQLVVNPQMYESLNGASEELHQLMKDFRANPKKFLRIKLSLF